MIDYAIILCFDSDTESKFNRIIESIAGRGISSYMTDIKIPPHITLSCFRTENIETIVNKLDGCVPGFKPGNITWASLGAFVPNVLFAAPVLNEQLLNACININRLIKPFSTAGDNGHYLPYQWVPHTALAVKLSNGELKKAFDIVAEQFVPINGKSNRILIAECNPFKAIKIWNL